MFHAAITFRLEAAPGGDPTNHERSLFYRGNGWCFVDVCSCVDLYTFDHSECNRRSVFLFSVTTSSLYHNSNISSEM